MAMKLARRKEGLLTRLPTPRRGEKKKKGGGKRGNGIKQVETFSC